MQVIPLLTSQVVAPGTYPFSAVQVPAGTTHVHIDFDSPAPPADSVIVFTAERSDDGVTYVAVSRLEMSGGVSRKTHTLVDVHGNLDIEVVPGQYYLSTLTVTGSPVTLSATATLTP